MNRADAGRACEKSADNMREAASRVRGAVAASEARKKALKKKTAGVN